MKCSAIVAQANKLLGMISWLLDYTNADTSARSVISTIRYRIWKDHFEKASSAWNNQDNP